MTKPAASTADIWNNLTSIRSIDDAVRMWPEVNTELAALDPENTIRIAMMLAVSAQIPLKEGILEKFTKGLNAIDNVLTNTPNLSNQLNFVLDAFATVIASKVDTTDIVLVDKALHEAAQRTHENTREVTQI